MAPQENNRDLGARDASELTAEGLVGELVFERGGTIRECNQAFAGTFGYDVIEEVIGSSLVELFRSRGDYDRLLDRLGLRRGAEMVEIDAISVTGRPLSLLGNFLGSFSDDGDLETVAARTFDVTERKILESQLIQSQRLEAVGQLAGGIAHDFNNLLTALLGYVYLAEERTEYARAGGDELVEIRKAAERAASLTHQLLAFAQRQAVRPQVVDLFDILAEVGGLIRSTVGEHTEVIVRGEAGTGRVRIDPSQIEQMLVNLAVNSHDAMPSGGRLTIGIDAVEVDGVFARQHPDTRMDPGPYVVLSVTDTGSGMTAQVRRRAFEPFYTTKEVGYGTGLGLATVYGIATQNGGHVSIYSEPGLGTTFKVYLPRVFEALEYRPEPVRLGAALGGSETVLVVEDEPAVREITRQSLMRFGYRVFEADSGEAAIRLVDKLANRIDLLLSDVVMPGMNGPEMAEQLLERQPDLKILFMSGWPKEAKVLRPALSALGPLLEKPFTTQVLLEAVRQALGARAESDSTTRS